MRECPNNFKPKAVAWSFRWHEAAKPGMYVVSCYVVGLQGSSTNVNAVVDDFGELVVVS